MFLLELIINTTQEYFDINVPCYIDDKKEAHYNFEEIGFQLNNFVFTDIPAGLNNFVFTGIPAGFKYFIVEGVAPSLVVLGVFGLTSYVTFFSVEILWLLEHSYILQSTGIFHVLDIINHSPAALVEVMSYTNEVFGVFLKYYINNYVVHDYDYWLETSEDGYDELEAAYRLSLQPEDTGSFLDGFASARFQMPTLYISHGRILLDSFTNALFHRDIDEETPFLIRQVHRCCMRVVAYCNSW